MQSAPACYVGALSFIIDAHCSPYTAIWPSTLLGETGIRKLFLEPLRIVVTALHNISQGNVRLPCILKLLLVQDDRFHKKRRYTMCVKRLNLLDQEPRLYVVFLVPFQNGVYSDCANVP